MNDPRIPFDEEGGIYDAIPSNRQKRWTVIPTAIPQEFRELLGTDKPQVWKIFTIYAHD